MQDSGEGYFQVQHCDWDWHNTPPLYYTRSGESIWLPCLSYHLPSSEVRLFSPQTYHTIYGGHSRVAGDHVDMFVNGTTIDIPIDRETANVPMVLNSFVSSRVMKRVGPRVKSALPAVDR